MILGENLHFVKVSDTFYRSTNDINDDLTALGYTMFKVVYQSDTSKWELYYLCYFLGEYATPEEAIKEAREYEINEIILAQ